MAKAGKRKPPVDRLQTLVERAADGISDMARVQFALQFHLTQHDDIRRSIERLAKDGSEDAAAMLRVFPTFKSTDSMKDIAFRLKQFGRMMRDLRKEYEAEMDKLST